MSQIKLLSVDLPTLAEVQAERAGKPIPKGPSRLERRTNQGREARQAAEAFRRAVWARDRHHCRQCGRKVIRTLKRQVDRGEVHHLHGRLGALRYEPKAAILTCLNCHELLTGRVNERWRVIGSATFGDGWTDATGELRFEQIA